MIRPPRKYLATKHERDAGNYVSGWAHFSESHRNSKGEKRLQLGPCSVHFQAFGRVIKPEQSNKARILPSIRHTISACPTAHAPREAPEMCAVGPYHAGGRQKMRSEKVQQDLYMTKPQITVHGSALGGVGNPRGPRQRATSSTATARPRLFSIFLIGLGSKKGHRDAPSTSPRRRRDGSLQTHVKRCLDAEVSSCGCVGAVYICWSVKLRRYPEYLQFEGFAAGASPSAVMPPMILEGLHSHSRVKIFKALLGASRKHDGIRNIINTR